MQQRRRPGHQYWFPARRYFWGMPHTWQGWIALDIYIAIMISGLFLALFGGGGNATFGILMILVGTMCFIYVCMKTGQPRRRF